jgi:predicted dehydrogenase
MSPIRVSVIGAGMALQCLHWPSIVLNPDLFTLHSVLDRSGRGGVQDICGKDVKVVRSLSEVVEDPEVDLVRISLSGWVVSVIY